METDITNVLLGKIHADQQQITGLDGMLAQSTKKGIMNDRTTQCIQGQSKNSWT